MLTMEGASATPASNGGDGGIGCSVRRSFGVAMGRRNGMKKAHKKVVGELTIDTGFAQASHTPVQQCNAACRISKAPAPSPSCGYGASDVTPWLLLGARDDMENADQLHALGVTHILSICDDLEASTCSPAPPGFPYCLIVVNDSSDANIESHFGRAFSFIDNTHTNHGKVLVQCRKGISRSATLVIAYLMQHHCWPFERTYDYVKAKRSIINPNLGFILALENFGRLNRYGCPQLGQPKTPVMLPSGKSSSPTNSPSGDTETSSAVLSPFSPIEPK